jgi:L-fucose mutarotase
MRRAAATLGYVVRRRWRHRNVAAVIDGTERLTMLKGIPAVLSPELLYLMAQMGHGDELVLADGNFPAVSVAKRVVRADGHGVLAILDAVLKLFPLDSFVEQPAAVMRRVDEPDQTAPIWHEFQKLLDRASGKHVSIERAERFAFYERAKSAFGVVATGETALYGNLIIKKGVIVADPSLIKRG